MSSRRFAPLFWCQFLAALNDNFVKSALVILVLYKIGAEQGAALVTLAGAVLVMPAFLLSALGGELADKYDKAHVAFWIRVGELPVALLAAAGFLMSGSSDPAIAQASVPVLFAALFGFGCWAAIFGPMKYGILPDHLTVAELPAGNALVEGATFLAILLGTIAGGFAMATTASGEPAIPEWAIAVIILAFAGLCLLSARLIKETGPGDPNLPITRNIFASTFRLVGELYSDRRLWVGGLITSWFWMAGIVALSLLPTLVKDVLGGNEQVATLSLVTFTVGIAIGSYLAARASRTRPNLALVPIGALLMALFALDIAWTVSTVPAATGRLGPMEILSQAWGLRLALDLTGFAAAGGLYIVPSFAALQSWAKADHRARVIAGVNIINAAAMTTGTLTVTALQLNGVGVPALFAGLGFLNLVVMALVLYAWGREGLQDLGRFLFRQLLGLEVKGLENLPKAGTRAVIAPNHVSLLDAPILFSILPGHAGYAIDTQMAQKWWIRPFLKLAKAWTIDPTRPLGARSLINHVKDGETLVIFPEGRLTVTGGLMKVYDGTAMIADKADAVVVPVRIDGLERSPFGYMNRMQTKKAWLPKTTVTILPPVKLDVPAGLKGRARRQAAGARLQDIMVDAAVATADIDQTLFSALAAASRTRDTGRPIVEDPLGTTLTYGRMITAAQVLGRKLMPLAGPGEAVGVMLPNSAGVAVTFFALQTIGRVP
ncbi:MAG: MFS transporter, partial [Hyphomicrobiaceae bacterium]|nr:MFS transporter [Hyphomicrobiaceae bacterium]